MRGVEGVSTFLETAAAAALGATASLVLETSIDGVDLVGVIGGQVWRVVVLNGVD